MSMGNSQESILFCPHQDDTCAGQKCCPELGALVIIYLLTLVPWPHPHVVKLICSKDNTRLVRKLIQTKWMPIFEKYQVRLPLECPLHPLRDIFAPQQDAKSKNRPTQWTCRLCGKSFFEEKFVDNHFESRHKDVINKAEDAVCFSDFCDILRCEVFSSQDSNLIIEDSYIVTDMEVWGDSNRQSLSLAQASPMYLNLISQRRNKFLLSTLAPTKAAGADEQRRPPSSEKRTSKTEDSAGKLSSKNASGNDDAHANFSEGGRKQGEYLSNAQRFRTDCKSEELAKLRVKCELLIRTCVTGLLLQMTDYAFKEMEEELNRAICWYLSCDRYWEDGPLEPKAFPWGLILVLVMVLSLGICFCYYIIWILFDSEEAVNRTPTLGHHSPRYIRDGALDRRKNNSRSSVLAVPDCEPDIRGQHYPEEPTIRAENSDLSHSEHYIYVTYPPDLKRRLLEKYE